MPGFDQAGSYAIAIWADDGFVRTETTLALTVTNVNAPPIFDALLGLSVLEGQEIAFRAFAFDPDNPEFAIQDRLTNGDLTALETTAPTVVYTTGGFPGGASFDPDTAIFRWTPSFSQSGSYTLRFIATDEGNGTGIPLTTTVDVPVFVRNANRAPVEQEINNVTVDRGASIDLALAFPDPDGNAVILSALDLPDFATLTDNGDATGILHIAPGADDRGDYVVTITARPPIWPLVTSST